MTTIFFTHQFIREIKRIENIATKPHQYWATQFLWHGRDIGHVHKWGIFDIKLRSKELHKYLLNTKAVERHHYLPNSLWATFRIRNKKDVLNAIKLAKASMVYIPSSKEEINDKKEQLIKELRCTEHKNFFDKTLIKGISEI